MQVTMNLIDDPIIILQDFYKAKLEKLISHKNVWQEKIDELNTEIHQTKMLIMMLMDIKENKKGK